MISLLTLSWLNFTVVVERLGWVLLHSLWQFALVALLAGVTVRALRRRSASTRYVVLVVAMAVSVAVPAATWMLQHGEASGHWTSRKVSPDTADEAGRRVPPSNLADDPTLASAAPLETPIPGHTGSRTAIQEVPRQTPMEGVTAPPRLEQARTISQLWLTWIVAGWSLGVVICSLRPLLGWHTLRRLRRVGVSPVSDEVLTVTQSLSNRLGLRCAVLVLQSTLARMPIVVGYVRPVILLPVCLLTSIPAAQLEAILAHELAHVRRHDFVVNLLQTLVETLFFYHPAVWWLSRQIRVEREHCCDDRVVALLDNRVEYGRALVAVEELQGRHLVLALGVNDGSLLARIRRIVGVGPDCTPHERWPAALLGLVLLGAMCALSMTWSVAAPDDVRHPKYETLVSKEPVSLLSVLADEPKSARDTFRKIKLTPKKEVGATAPAKGLEFLEPYPNLHGLSLAMTEPQFRAFAKKGELILQMTPRAKDRSTYSIPTGDGHTVIVVFQGGKCRGIQRIRGEDRVDKISFESVTVTFKAALGNDQPQQIQIKADGSCVYHIDRRHARGDIQKRPEARLTSKISPQRMLELERLLAKTNWLTVAGGEGPARHTDAEEITITVARDDQTKTVVCIGMRPEPYHSLLWFLRGMAEQEKLVYVIDWLHGSDTDRKRALIRLRFEVDALNGRPGRALPYLELDYNRFLPTFTRMVRNPSTVEDEVLTAIKLVTFVRADSELEWIARLKHDRESRVRNTVAAALADFGGERVLATLVEMAPTTAEARWGLIRLQEIAVPSLVKLIETGRTSTDITSEHMVRAFLDHRSELPGPIDDRIVTAARQALAKTTERHQRTEYFKEFLQLADEQRGASLPGSPLGAGKVETAPADEAITFRGVKLTAQLKSDDGQSKDGNTNRDPRSNEAAGSGVPRQTQVFAEIPAAEYQRPTADDQKATAMIPADSWGSPVNGLRAAILMQSPPVDQKDSLRYQLVVENVSNHDIRFSATVAPDFRDFHLDLCTLSLFGLDDEPLPREKPNLVSYVVQPWLSRFWLKAGERAFVRRDGRMALARLDLQGVPVTRPQPQRASAFFNVRPGRYSVSATVELGRETRSTSPGGIATVLSPAKGEWSGKLKTGTLPVALFDDSGRVTGKYLATARPKQPELMVGEPGWISFDVHNQTDIDKRVIVGGDYRNALGRPDSFKVDVFDADGRRVAQPSIGIDMGGISHPMPLPAKQSAGFELFLPHWATITKPGKYRFTVWRELDVIPSEKDSAGQDPFALKPDKVLVAAETAFTVVARDEAKFGELIERLGPMLIREHESQLADQMLRAIRVPLEWSQRAASTPDTGELAPDERAVPWYLKYLAQTHSARKRTALRFLGECRSEMAFDAIVKSLDVTADDIRGTPTRELAESSAHSVHQAATHALATFATNQPLHPRATNRLFALADHPHMPVRLTVLHFAAKVKTREARAIIAAMTNDKDQRLATEAKRYQKLLAD